MTWLNPLNWNSFNLTQRIGHWNEFEFSHLTSWPILVECARVPWNVVTAFHGRWTHLKLFKVRETLEATSCWLKFSIRMNVVFSRSKCVPGVSRTLKMCRNCWNKTTALPECWDRVPPAAQRKIFAKKIFQRIFFPKFFQKFKKVEQNVFLPDATRCRDRRSVVGWWDAASSFHSSHVDEHRTAHWIF